MTVTPNYEYALKNQIYQLCNREQYFTCGSNRQYERMLEMATDPMFGCEDVAVAIWICSDDKEFHTIMEQLLNIWKDIEEAEALTRMEEQQAAGERAADEIYCSYYE